MADRPVLIVGATGMLGRPVARRLVQEQRSVRALVRDPQRARTLLPEACELVQGDVRDQSTLHAAMEGSHAVYINLSEPFSRRRWDPERAGTGAIARGARSCGVSRLLKISAMGAAEAAGAWWAARRKLEAEAALADSGVAYTVFRPTWFMESIPLFMMGRSLVVPRTPDVPLHWIAADDYARQVAAALRSEQAANRIYTVQGPEPLTFSRAITRFAAAHPRSLRVRTLPPGLLPLFGMLSPQVRYLRELLDFTFKWNTGFASQATWDDLVKPTMTIEDYVAYMQETGDVPKK
ncbi:MAG: SDR family oxidoreductase [Planctomycetota bacterium]